MLLLGPYGGVVADRVATGVPAFLVSLALVLPLTIGFAWVFAGVFETPFRRAHGASQVARRRRPRAEGVPA